MTCHSGTTKLNSYILLIALACLATACSRSPQPTPDYTAPDTEPGAEDQTAADRGDASAASPLAARKTWADIIEYNFEGQAASYMSARAKNAPGPLHDTVRQLTLETAELEGCRPAAGQTDTFEVDIDDDGVAEGLSLYTLQACGSGNAVRVISVFRSPSNGKWIPVLTAAISTRPGVRRPIISIGDGRVTLAGNDESFEGMQPPETIEIPELGGEGGATE